MTECPLESNCQQKGKSRRVCVAFESAIRSELSKDSPLEEGEGSGEGEMKSHHSYRDPPPKKTKKISTRA